MRVGVVYPQVELAHDPDSIGRFGVAAEELGYDHMLAYDHVLGADHSGRDPRLWGPYTDDDPFHDPFVMFAYLAAVTERIELVTGVLVLPQRQAALVARQAASVDLLARGRLRLGVGTGWNYVEYEALGISYEDRGGILDEQVELLRRFWSDPLVSFDGAFHTVTRAGLNPRPKATIPIWFGGGSEPAFRRAARSGDGFIYGGSLEGVIPQKERIEHHLDEMGRSRRDFGHELLLGGGHTVDEVTVKSQAWERAGGTHVTVISMGLGLDTTEGHIDFIGQTAEALRSHL